MTHRESIQEVKAAMKQAVITSGIKQCIFRYPAIPIKKSPESSAGAGTRSGTTFAPTNKKDCLGWIV